MELNMDLSWNSEQRAIFEEIKSFAMKELNEDLPQRDKECTFSRIGWKKCADIGIQGLPISEEYGGAGADILTTIHAMEALGFGCKDNGLIHSINSHMWGCEIPISKFGTEKQKQTYLLSLCKGEIIGGHAITEAEAGSDAFSIKMTALRDRDHYVITGSKSIVSNGPISDVIVAFAATNPNRKFLGGISAFIVEKNTPGLNMGEPLETMGLRTSPIGELFFDECRVPVGNLLGEEGSGMRIFNETMEWEKSCLFACHLGTMERILNDCIRYAKERSQFGQRIGKFQSISNKIADLRMNVELGKLILYRVGWLKSQNKNVMLESAIAKLFISESFKAAALDSVQIHGSYGYMSELGFEKEVRDSVASTIYSGTSEIQRNIIARCLGL
jgi:alkylation response protein AidB-like acyl-CoA dehydrogenase